MLTCATLLGAVQIEAIQQCLSNIGRVIVPVESNSSDKTYDVLAMSPVDPDVAICECEGYAFRGRCSHQKVAVSRLCRWSEATGPEEQEGPDRRNRICPRCMGPTMWIEVERE